MTLNIAVSPRAKADLLRLNEFLAEKSERAALRAMETINSGLESLKYLPNRAPGRPNGGRTLNIRFGDSGYSVEYRVDGETVVIARIFHMREDRD